jgi:hypothetical protein
MTVMTPMPMPQSSDAMGFLHHHCLKRVIADSLMKARSIV